MPSTTDLERQDAHDPAPSPSPSTPVEEKQPGPSIPSIVSAEFSAERGDPLDWNGPGDTSNPRNWRLAQRVFHTALPALQCFMITIATSVYTPAIPFAQVRFGVSREVAVLGLSLYTVGLALGPLIAAPISEVFGRRAVYLVTLALLLAFTAGAGGAQNIETLLICRFFAGAGGSAAIAVGAGTLADLWDTNKSGGMASLFFILAPFLGPALGPLTGAYVIAEYDDNWRFSQWVILMIGAPILFASLFLKETSKAQILLARGKKTGTAVPVPNAAAVLRRSLIVALGRPLRMMFTEPLVGYLSLYTGFAFAMMFSYFGSFPYVFRKVYGFNSKHIGLAFLGLLPGFFLAVATFAVFDKTLFARAREAAGGKPAPEHRLYAALVGSFLLPIGLFWFAWAAREEVHWIVPVLSGVPFGWASLAIFVGFPSSLLPRTYSSGIQLSVTTYLVDVYQAASSASAIAANGILRYILGAAFPLFTIQMYQGLGIPWAGSTFAFVSLLMLPAPWVAFKYGKLLRARSSYHTNAA
ncbi:MAG: hypothetical protein M1832_000736 [Thelocarpon impressellum]|nr:MAG: hypothetical protein M1832_000736 [Thelocarpon impressellum]